MKSKECFSYYSAKETAKDAIDAGYTDVQILLDDDRWVVYYCDYLELDDVY